MTPTPDDHREDTDYREDAAAAPAGDDGGAAENDTPGPAPPEHGPPRPGEAATTDDEVTADDERTTGDGATTDGEAATGDRPTTSDGAATGGEATTRRDEEPAARTARLAGTPARLGAAGGRGTGRVLGTVRRLAPRVATLVVAVLAVSVAAAFVAFAVPQVVGATGSYVVLSGSMEPAISPGDVVFVYPADPATVRAGDVVTFATPGRAVPTTHRVVEVVETAEGGVLYRTKGDANEEADARLVAPTRLVGVVPARTLPVVGEVYAVVPSMGHVVRFAATGTGFALLVVVPLALLVLTEVRAVARRARAAGTVAGDATTTVDAERDAGSPGATGEEPGTGDDESGATAETVVTDADAVPLAGSTITVTDADLRMSLVALAGFAGYALVVARVHPSAWTVAVAVAATGVLALFAAVKVFAVAPGGTAGDATTPAEAAGPARTDGAGGLPTRAAAPDGEVTDRDD